MGIALINLLLQLVYLIRIRLTRHRQKALDAKRRRRVLCQHHRVEEALKYWRYPTACLRSSQNCALHDKLAGERHVRLRQRRQGRSRSGEFIFRHRANPRERDTDHGRGNAARAVAPHCAESDDLPHDRPKEP